MVFAKRKETDFSTMCFGQWRTNHNSIVALDITEL